MAVSENPTLVEVKRDKNLTVSHRLTLNNFWPRYLSEQQHNSGWRDNPAAVCRGELHRDSMQVLVAKHRKRKATVTKQCRLTERQFQILPLVMNTKNKSNAETHTAWLLAIRTRRSHLDEQQNVFNLKTTWINERSLQKQIVVADPVCHFVVKCGVRNYCYIFLNGYERGLRHWPWTAVSAGQVQPGTFVACYSPSLSLSLSLFPVIPLSLMVKNTCNDVMIVDSYQTYGGQNWSSRFPDFQSLARVKL